MLRQLGLASPKSVCPICQNTEARKSGGKVTIRVCEDCKATAARIERCH